MQKIISDRIRSLQAEMFDWLERLVLIQSGSRNKPGLDAMAREINGFLSAFLSHSEIIHMRDCGNMVRAWNSRAMLEKPVFLVGHMDTVFPQDTEFRMYREDADRAYGPGVMDMKGGLVVGLFALKALHDLGFLESIPVFVLFNSDEEIGSPCSRQFIEEQAVKSRHAFVLEGGGPEYQLAVGRKGKIGFDLNITGQAGHAGAAGLDKPSAVLEAAYKIIALEKLNRPPDILINVGTARGGMGPNSVAEKAALEVEVRFVDPEDQYHVLEKIGEIVSNSIVANTSSVMNILSKRPPMKTDGKIERLYAKVDAIAKKAGIPLDRETRGGVSDANFIAAMGVPVLDGMGPCGDLDHSVNEYIIKDTMVDRAILLALCLLEL